jgi:hypothetical protein
LNASAKEALINGLNKESNWDISGFFDLEQQKLENCRSNDPFYHHFCLWLPLFLTLGRLIPCGIPQQSDSHHAEMMGQ